MHNFEIAFQSLQGPKKVNEDTLKTCIQTDRKGHPILIAIVADGLGGYKAGDIASRYVTEQIEHWFYQHYAMLFQANFNAQHVAQQLQQLFFAMNDQLFQAMQLRGQKLGTTCSVLILYRGQSIIVHVGDSRVYRLQKSLLKRTQIEQLTQDHAWVQTEIEEGRLTKEQARIHNRRNVLLQCLGIEQALAPQVSLGTYVESDMFLLCTDGVHEVLAEQALFAPLLQSTFKPLSLQHRLSNWMNKLTPLFRDNASVILIADKNVNTVASIKNKITRLLKS